MGERRFPTTGKVQGMIDATEMGDLATPTKDIPAGGQKITGVGTPGVGTDAANKDYADGLAQGVDWQESVLDELADPPGSPSQGDRYLVIAAATGDWVGQENNIAEYNGSSWDFTVANKGMAVYIEDIGKQKNYNGTAWVMFGSTVSHSNLTDLGVPGDHPWAEQTANKGAVSGYPALDADQKVVQANANITFDAVNNELVVQVDDI